MSPRRRYRRCRRRRYAGRPVGPNIQALYDERVEDGCIICDEPVPRGRTRHRTMCDDIECLRAYRRAARADSYLRRGK